MKTEEIAIPYKHLTAFCVQLHFRIDIKHVEQANGCIFLTDGMDHTTRRTIDPAESLCNAHLNCSTKKGCKFHRIARRPIVI